MNIVLIVLFSILVGCAGKSSSTTEINYETRGGFPVYGNWCGPKHPKYGEGVDAPEPIDAVDSACKAHDLCYTKQGYSDCACDIALIAKLDRVKRASLEATTAAKGIKVFFSLYPCKGTDLVLKPVFLFYDQNTQKNQQFAEWLATPFIVMKMVLLTPQITLGMICRILEFKECEEWLDEHSLD